MDGSKHPPERLWYRDALWNLFIITCGFVLYILSYELLIRLYPGQRWAQDAIENSTQIAGLERSLGMLGEHTFQSFFLRHPSLLHLINLIYLWLNVPLIEVLAVWLFVFHRQQFRTIRNAMLTCGAVALIAAFVPTAPPYLVPGVHVIETTGTAGMSGIAEPQLFFNTYGAVPSIHVAWALLAGIAIWRCASPQWLRWLGLLLPFVMTVAVVATGNHFIFDAAAGAAVGLFGLWLGTWIERRWQVRHKYDGPIGVTDAVWRR